MSAPSGDRRVAAAPDDHLSTPRLNSPHMRCAGLHLGLARALHAGRWARVGVHHRACHAAATARQFGCRALRGEGNHQVHGPHHQSGCAQGSVQEDGAASGHPPLIRARDPVRRIAQHQPNRAEAADDPLPRDQGVLLQVQRPDLREPRRARPVNRLQPRPPPSASTCHFSPSTGR